MCCADRGKRGGTMGKKLIGRRDFMKSTLAGFGGLFFLPQIDMKQEVKVVEAKGKEKKFVYRTLGKTGFKLPVINMGVMLTDNPNIIRAALDSGVLLLDTAHGYMGGRNEETIGEVIKGRPRDSYYHCQQSESPPRSNKRLIHGRSNDRRVSQETGYQPEAFGH